MDAIAKMSNTRRLLFISLQAIFNAAIIGIIARLLVGLIDLITNLAFYGQFSFESARPIGHSLGIFVIAVPIIGGLIVGIIARFGSASIRGHGIPEAMEMVLKNKSKIAPIITLLKPLASAIAIGTGGPFGSEGPIIATGGAFGSGAGQIMRISAQERKIMLTAGATAGMAAIFGTPIAAVLLAIELLLFEYSPRSIIPVALSCATGAVFHFLLFEHGPTFKMPNVPAPSGIAIVTYILFGAVLGVMATFISKSTYIIEDLFEKLPVHWMWWPAIGGVAVGVIGYFAPSTLGVGYENISLLLSGKVTIATMVVLSLLKFLSWTISLGSGTSGGTLAPLLTIGGGLGLLLGTAILAVFPQSGIVLPLAALVGMAAVFAGAARALLTSIVFAFEVTLEPNSLIPLLGGCTAAYFVSYFMMKNTIMTEKINRRGIATPEALEPDILQRVIVKEVATEHANVLSTENTVKEAREWIKSRLHEEQNLTYVIVDAEKQLKGLVKRQDIFSKEFADDAPITHLIFNNDKFVFPNTYLSDVINIMDDIKTDTLPVISSKFVAGKNSLVIDVITQSDVFAAYRHRNEESKLDTPNISIKKQGIRVIAKGKSLFKFFEHH